MRPFLADLHVHSVLSACADDLMVPTAVLQAARERGLAIIAVADHNSAENTPAFVRAAQETGIKVIPGMEVTTREEVHVLTLFATVDQALAWQDRVYEHLPPLPNNERAFGVQLVVDEADRVVAVNERLLLTACTLSLDEVLHGVAEIGGISIPAHVDRPAFGLLGQLGFVPPDLDLPAVEVSRFVDPTRAVDLSPTLAGRTVLQSSDAHRLDDIGTSPTLLWMEEASLAELELLLRGVGERRVTYTGRRV